MIGIKLIIGYGLIYGLNKLIIFRKKVILAILYNLEPNKIFSGIPELIDALG